MGQEFMKKATVLLFGLICVQTLFGQITLNPIFNGEIQPPNFPYERVMPTLEGSDPLVSLSPLPVLDGYDFTSWGVSLDNRAATLITPLHFVTARHYRPAVGIEVVYRDAQGNQYVGTVASYDVIPNTDILVGTFEAEINSAIQPVNILEGQLDAGTEIVAGHKAFEIYVSSVELYQGDYGGYGGDTKLLTYSNPLINYGDSSFPSFVLDELGNTTVAGTHYRASRGNYAFDSALGLSYDQISAVVMADGYMIGVPEPSNYALILGLLILTFLLQRRVCKLNT